MKEYNSKRENGVPLQNMTKIPPGTSGKEQPGEDERYRRRPLRRRSHNTMEFIPSPKATQPRKKGITLATKKDEFVDLPKETNKRIDYVIIREKEKYEESKAKDTEKLEQRRELQRKFETALQQETIEVQEEGIGDHVFMKLHVPFKRLCQEAERTKLELPLEGCEIYEDEKGCCGGLHSCEDKYLRTDDEVDFVSAPYEIDKHFVFDDHAEADKFFRPTLRCFLAHHILLNIDIRKIGNDVEQEDPMAKKGLPYLLHKKVYKDAFILHDETKNDPREREEKDEMRAIHGSEFVDDPEDDTDLLNEDTRKELMDTWGVICPQRYQPFWKIRNYFGEKIALYFAWVGILITTLWLPAIFGLAVFLYGLYLSATAKVQENQTANQTADGFVGQVTNLVDDSLGVLKQSFDNTVTPFYALVICLWGTVFLEVWKRRNATLSYEWDVDHFEDNEVDRPKFVGTKVKPDPVTKEDTWYYPMSRQFMKFLASFSFLIMMIIVVFIAAGSVILYRVFVTIEYCDNLSSVGCLLVTTLASSVLNAVAILILGKVYDILAVILTDWENHRTQTQYDDALILKLFAFQFANSYTSCFYIAFLRGLEPEDGLFGLGPQYQDSCGTDRNCTTMLSFQVFVLMLFKPIPKLLKDIIIPWLRKKWRLRKCCRRDNRVGREGEAEAESVLHDYLERERLKPETGDVTLGEYTEKVLLYGFLMLFAASLPLGPLIALIIVLIDIRVDARRLLWMYRRPVSIIAQDIGMWYGILQFLNFVGVISNAFLIAFRSSWASNFTFTEKLWVVIIFEHIVLAVKGILHVIIPDKPRSLQLSKKREKYQVSRIMQAAHEQTLKERVDLAVTGHSKKPKHSRYDTIPEDEDFPNDYATHEDETNLLPRRGKTKGRSHGTGHSDHSEDDPDLEKPTNVHRRKKKRASLQVLGAVSELEKGRKNTTSTHANAPPPPPELSYGAGGDTFMGDAEEKFPGLRPKHPPTEIVSDDDGPRYGGHNFAYDDDYHGNSHA